MSISTEPLYDIFIASSSLERELRHQVANALTDAGIKVYVPEATIRPDGLHGDEMRLAMAESKIVGVLVGRSGNVPDTTAFETGAAIAWGKPIIVIRPDEAQADVPIYLRNYRSFPISKLDEAVDAIQKATSSIEPDDRKPLAVAYERVGIPADRLATDPIRLQTLASEFESLAGKYVPPEALISELLTMRKRGLLPRLMREPGHEK